MFSAFFVEIRVFSRSLRNFRQNAVAHMRQKYFFINKRERDTYKNRSFFVDYFYFRLFIIMKERERERGKMVDKMVYNKGNGEMCQNSDFLFPSTLWLFSSSSSPSEKCKNQNKNIFRLLDTFSVCLSQGFQNQIHRRATFQRKSTQRAAVD
jgi:hypothetical protein